MTIVLSFFRVVVVRAASLCGPQGMVVGIRTLVTVMAIPIVFIPCRSAAPPRVDTFHGILRSALPPCLPPTAAAQGKNIRW